MGLLFNITALYRRGEEASWSKDCLAEILCLLLQRPLPQDQKQGKWQVHCTHIERVKSYSPHVYHLVADISCSYTVSELPEVAEGCTYIDSLDKKKQ